jgi:D-arabinose 1-dehydrogenase-like Zn-dependent alcohol dehydrogenase
MSKMRAVDATSPKGPLKMVEREIPQPSPRKVRIKVQACGLCHSDSFTKEGTWLGITFPRVPGHDVLARPQSSTSMHAEPASRKRTD